MKFSYTKSIKSMLTALIILSSVIINCNISQAAVNAPVKPAAEAQKTIYTPAAPLDIVKNPLQYLKKNVTFNAEFVAFTSLGLDYKPALREGSKYVGILIKRDDSQNTVIPLSELKMFLTRENAEKHIDLEAGDKIKISGTVFSAALGDAWLDIKELKLISHKSK